MFLEADVVLVSYQIQGNQVRQFAFFLFRLGSATLPCEHGSGVILEHRTTGSPREQYMFIPAHHFHQTLSSPIVELTETYVDHCRSDFAVLAVAVLRPDYYIVHTVA